MSIRRARLPARSDDGIIVETRRSVVVLSPGENRMRKLQLLGGVSLFVLVNAAARPAPFDCLIEPTQAIDLSSPVSGLLEKILVRRGDRVAAGQVLAVLESQAERAATELARFKAQANGPTVTAEQKIEFSKRKYQRRMLMAAENLMSSQERDDAEAEYKLAEAELLVAKENKQIAHFEYLHQN